MAFFKNKKIETQHITRRTYDYKKNGVSLSFTLNIENQREMSDFIELLKEAITELETK